MTETDPSGGATRADSQPPACTAPERRELDRREFLRRGSGTLAGTVAAAILPALPAVAAVPETKARRPDSAPPAAPGRSSPGAPAADDGYPVVDIAALDAIHEGVPIAFGYPDARSPAMLLRLGEAAQDGVGPGSSLVAYSTLCTHKGCPVQYRHERRLLICPCHWSTFDPAKAGQMVIGQGSDPLPRIRLRISGSRVQAIGIDGLIFGRRTNVA
jgi:arsenite oxidase small subunit